MNLDELYKIHPNRRKKKIKTQLLELFENFNSLSVGDNVVCIEDRGNGRYGMLGWNNGDYTKAKTLTYGKSYKIVEIKNNKIKFVGDDSILRWYGLKRFIFSIKKQRKQKLEQIFKTIKE